MRSENHVKVDADVAGRQHTPPAPRPSGDAASPGDATAFGGRMFEMSDKDRRRPPPAAAAGKAPAAGSEPARSEPMKRRSSLDAGFDTYLSRELHQLYDPVLGETIPDEIAALLAGFDRRGGPDDDEGGEGGAGGGGPVRSNGKG